MCNQDRECKNNSHLVNWNCCLTRAAVCKRNKAEMAASHLNPLVNPITGLSPSGRGPHASFVLFAFCYCFLFPEQALSNTPHAPSSGQRAWIKRTKGTAMQKYCPYHRCPFGGNRWPWQMKKPPRKPGPSILVPKPPKRTPMVLTLIQFHGHCSLTACNV